MLRTDGQTDRRTDTFAIGKTALHMQRAVKMDFARRKYAAKLVCVKTVSGIVVRHSLSYLSVHKWLVGDVHYALSNEPKMNVVPCL